MKRSQIIIFSIFLLIGVFLAAAIGGKYYENRFLIPQAWTKKRIRNIVSFLSNEGLHNKNLILFLGVSEGEVGFSPIEYDRANLEKGIDSYSANLAVRNLGAIYSIYLQRIGLELKRNKLRPQIIFLHLPVSRLTIKARQSNFELSKANSAEAVLFSPEMILNERLAISKRSLLLIEKYFFSEMHLSVLLSDLSGRIRKSFSAFETEEIEHLRRWSHPFLYQSKPWNIVSKGQYEFPMVNGVSGVEKFAKNFLSNRFLEVRIRQHVDCCDFLELKMDEKYVEDVAESIAELKRVAKQVIILKLPENPHLVRTDASRETIRRIHEQVATTSGASVWDIGSAENFDREDFIDVLHFMPSGSRKFAKVVSEMTNLDWFKTENK